MPGAFRATEWCEVEKLMTILFIRRTKLFFAILCLAVVGSLVSTPLPAQEEDKPYEVVDGVVDWYTYSGFRRYHSECHVCHGPDGMGSLLRPGPAGFTEGHAL